MQKEKEHPIPLIELNVISGCQRSPSQVVTILASDRNSDYPQKWLNLARVKLGSSKRTCSTIQDITDTRDTAVAGDVACRSMTLSRTAVRQEPVRVLLPDAELSKS
jgi:hypothetical protein